jgi:hypothetical protein
MRSFRFKNADAVQWILILEIIFLIATMAHFRFYGLFHSPVHACKVAPKIVPGTGGLDAVLSYEQCGDLDSPNRVVVRLTRKGEKGDIVFAARPFGVDAEHGMLTLVPAFNLHWAGPAELSIRTEKIWSVETQRPELDGVRIDYRIGTVLTAGETALPGNAHDP